MRRSCPFWWLLAAALLAFSCARTGVHSEIVAHSPPLSSEETPAHKAQTEEALPVPPSATLDDQGRGDEKRLQSVEIDDIIDAHLAASVLWGVSVRSLDTGQSLLGTEREEALHPSLQHEATDHGGRPHQARA